MSKPQPQGIKFREPPIFERGAKGRSGASLAPLDVPEIDPATHFKDLARKEPAGLPEVSEPEAFRHFLRLSQWNFCIDSQMYPLGSCTMKYNPKVNEWAARVPGFLKLHPETPDELAQGTLEIMWHLQQMLCEVSGMDACSLQPSAGAQGELTGLMMMRAYHQAQGRSPKKVFIPESAHGTNPASCTLNGLVAVKIEKNAEGVVRPEEVLAAIEREGGDDVCGLMITNPNTLGVYEKHLPQIIDLIHKKGGLVYGDGANTNAIMGTARPGDIGVDVIHINLHKTFTTPHGGGGPGSGPVCFKKHLEPFQPAPVLVRRDDGAFAFDRDRPQSIGRVRAFNGNFGMFVRAYTYIREMGGDGLKMASTLAVLNARYLWARLKDDYLAPVKEPCMHEVVLSDVQIEKETGVKTLDIAKRLLDYGFHAPTVYFPLVVPGALMIEPTETETKETLDEFVEAMKSIAREARENPSLVKGAPHNSIVGRMDEARAARQPRLRWRPSPEGG
ncbi:aminomethyl-transferring glycine dehydrogenase subunit GcvPB [Polyangium aurulentum]|uniref:aminomethyl-transferring glycine dehydrogenase subunit GcvPB n=1 Tax=Polyangium aurulentum TaxID=2567896 RepID=UPI0010AE6F12|nr:aminomethyl-transferring glycine dehydrogenase subunit GcvPB [Polyangium aurulentum]UQA62583.1 aminomethyl-transferring glycine dehydrogenase subunit GcvPB [Polyangium aurulentum]